MDLINRQDAIDAINKYGSVWMEYTDTMSIDEIAERALKASKQSMVKILHDLPYATERRGEWIPCSERLPEDIRPVIVTWKNTDPASYYQYIVGKHFTGTACYKNGKWYWYSSTTEDMLAEYGRYDSEEFDEAIECIAWMPLPSPYVARIKRGEEE